MDQPQIFLSSWAIKKSIENGEKRVLDLPALAKENDFQGVEIIDRHLPDLARGTLQHLKNAIVETGIGVTLGISTDFTSDVEFELEAQIQYTKKMLEIAEFFEARSLRILLGGNEFFFQKWMRSKKVDRQSSQLTEIKKKKKLTNWLQKIGIFHILHKLTIQAKRPRPLKEQVKRRVLRALDQIVPLAENRKIPLAIENHWGITTLPENILFFVNHYHSSFLGTCPDLGNFSHWQNRYSEIEKLLPHAKEIHAKTYAFDGSGNEKTIDYGRMISLVREARFSGMIVIEYEGSGDQLENSLHSRDLVLKNWNQS
ncbi:MAG: sugar phosphate isomerase/epimerase [Calditrichaeota bacterium]|nr:sugar phosphate isomerase/epimerase [Calditrichota bacterium]